MKHPTIHAMNDDLPLTHYTNAIADIDLSLGVLNKIALRTKDIDPERHDRVTKLIDVHLDRRLSLCILRDLTSEDLSEVKLPVREFFWRDDYQNEE